MNAIFAVLLLLCVTGVASAGSDAGGDGAMAVAVDRALTAAAFRGARVGILVRRCGNSKEIFSRGADTPLAPASNQKLLTALSALATWGPAHRFVTRVYADHLPDERGEVGMLAVRGGGDPALTSEDWWRFSADLRRLGLREVRGDLILDDAVFDQQRWNPAWGDPSSRAYYPAIGSLMANYGAFTVEVRPGQTVGAAARVSIDPPVDFFEVVNKATTVAAGKTAAVEIDRRSAGKVERVVVEGRVGVGSPPRVIYRSVSDPTAYAGAVMVQQLAANGIGIGGERRVGSVPAGAVELLAFEGRALAEIVRLFMKYSNNAIAEALLKGLATRTGDSVGSWTGGVAAMRQELSEVGVAGEGVVLLDGSGLAPGNRVTARALLSALCVARSSFAFGPELVASLPIAGSDGTLANRSPRTGMIRAKTGLLSGVVGLSGYAARDGDEVAFSILVNGYDVGDDQMMRAVDEVANALSGALSRSAGE